MALQNRDKIEAFRVQTQMKVVTLLEEFAAGKINREQFHAVYAHHSSQLQIADQALQEDTAGGFEPTAGQTIAIRQAHMGKAIGLMIYHNKSGMFVDTLGAFDIPSARIAAILNDFSQMMEEERLIDRRIEHFGERQWLLFGAGRHTTVVTLFHNEPSPAQSREIERLHHDFEVANQRQLSSFRVDASKLAYPFLVFVQQKLKRV
jgi:hypothetical protein